MKVLIVAKTHVQNVICVGGLDLATNKGVRLLTSEARYQPPNTPYEVGQLWELDCEPRKVITPPHVEDALVYAGRHVGAVEHLRQFLLERIRPWRGDPGQTFEGLLRATYEGSGYVNDIVGVPPVSTGFWVANNDLDLTELPEKGGYYFCPRRTGLRKFKYVGCATPTRRIPEGALVRLSLARWWKPENAGDVEARCYLQLSGWYP